MTDDVFSTACSRSFGDRATELSNAGVPQFLEATRESTACRRIARGNVRWCSNLHSAVQAVSDLENELRNVCDLPQLVLAFQQARHRSIHRVMES
jgi:hypothetical protein